MIKALVDLDENLASSIALRYVSHLSTLIDLRVQIIHVEEIEAGEHTSGSGWVRKTWEKGVADAGAAAIHRLLKTEKVDCSLTAVPRITIGSHDDELLEELRTYAYDLFVRGMVSTSKVGDFYQLITAKLFANCSCPMLIVKNLIINNKVVLLCGDGVDLQSLIPQFVKIYSGAELDLELIYYKFQDNNELLFFDKSEAGSVLLEAEEMLRTAGMAPTRSKVLSGSPEQVGEYFSSCGLVVSTFPTRRGPRMDLLANAPSPLLLCR